MQDGALYILIDVCTRFSTTDYNLCFSVSVYSKRNAIIQSAKLKNFNQRIPGSPEKNIHDTFEGKIKKFKVHAVV